MNLIEAREVTLRYGRSKTAVDRVSFDLPKGRVVGLMLARLGRFVQQQLRPLPMLPAEKPVQPLLQSLIQQLLQRPPAQ